MDADPQGRQQGELAPEGLSERVARLEAEVRTLLGDVAALRSERHVAAAQPAHPDPALTSAERPKLSQPPLPSGERATFEAAAQEPVRQNAGASSAATVPLRPPEPSLESRLGSAVLSKVAVVLLLLGVAWFLKWAFDNRWIGPAGRVGAGLAAGAGVIWWSERFRRQQLAAFSYALKAVGSGVLYLTLWASVHLYHIAPAPVAFACMVGVTAWNAAMAWSQDAQLLAGYALLGAYLTPLLLRSGGNHEVFLFSYLLVIALALLGLLRFKTWSPLLLGAIGATAAIFAAWFVTFFDATQVARTAIFAILLWAVFAVVPLLAAAAGDVVSTVLAPGAAGVFGGVALYSVLADGGARQWEAWCAVGFAALYLALARLLRARSTVAAVHVTVAVAFITAAIPLKATGRGILWGWWLEAIALIASSTMASSTIAISTSAISTRANSTLQAGAHPTKAVLRVLGSAVGLLAAGGVLIQPWLFPDAGPEIFNSDFTTSLGAVAALAILLVLTQRMREDDAAETAGRSIAAGSLILLNLVLLVAVYRELRLPVAGPQNVQPGTQLAPGSWTQTRSHADFAFSAWMMMQGAVMLAAGFWKRAALARWIGLTLLVATVVKTFAYDMRGLGTGYRVVSYLGLGVLLMGVSFAYQKDWLGRLATDPVDGGDKPRDEVKA